MREYYIKGVSEKLIKLHMSNYQRIIDLAPAIIAVVQRFDGKQANKRLETALKEVDKHIFVKFDTSYDGAVSLDIQIYYEHRSVSGKKDSSGYATTHYISDTSGTICSAYKDHHPVVDGKIVAENIIARIQDQSDSLVKILKETEEQLIQVEALRQFKQDMEERIERHNDSLTWLIDVYFALRIKS